MVAMLYLSHIMGSTPRLGGPPGTPAAPANPRRPRVSAACVGDCSPCASSSGSSPPSACSPPLSPMSVLPFAGQLGKAQGGLWPHVDVDMADGGTAMGSAVEAAACLALLLGSGITTP